MLGLKNITKLTTDTDIISELSTRPVISAQALKAKFDEGNTAIKADINAVIDDLNANIEILNSLMSNKEITDAIDAKVVEVGSGDMSKAIYDSNDDGTVNNADRLEGKTISEILNVVFPVGSIKITANNINPSTYLGGTWERWGAGRFILGLGTATQNNNASFGSIDKFYDFITPEATSGEYNHKLTTSEIPAHAHDVNNCPGNAVGNDWVGQSGTAKITTRTTSSTGGSATHNNMPPYITAYMWKRIA